jgi:hypothetical protein
MNFIAWPIIIDEFHNYLVAADFQEADGKIG